ncbi:unnamed protein product [Dovyalis caffra]|uniref:Uncharacterized protein n=1 Tax=Dovyalis caffra TaxID=77055 RepID=A0AAV1S6Z7_9ROSI|nr:unnamed protein product [Dovyalis caffra]
MVGPNGTTDLSCLSRLGELFGVLHYLSRPSQLIQSVINKSSSDGPSISPIVFVEDIAMFPARAVEDQVLAPQHSELSRKH